MMAEHSGDRASPGSQENGEVEESLIARLPDGNLLSQILQVSEQGEGDDGLFDGVEEGLLAVARRHPEAQQLNEELLRELIQALLRDVHHFELSSSARLVEWISHTLYGDPNGRLRLERLWRQLHGRCANEE